MPRGAFVRNETATSYISKHHTYDARAADVLAHFDALRDHNRRTGAVGESRSSGMALGRRSSRRPSRRPPIGWSDCTASSGCAWPTLLVKVWIYCTTTLFSLLENGIRRPTAARGPWCGSGRCRATWSRGGCGSSWTTATLIQRARAAFRIGLPRNASQAYDAVVFAEESDRSQLIEEGFHPLQLQEGYGVAPFPPKTLDDDGDDAYDAVVLADARDITTQEGRARSQRRAQDATGRPSGSSSGRRRVYDDLGRVPAQA